MDTDINDFKKKLKEFGGLLEAATSSGNKVVARGEASRKKAEYEEMQAREKLVKSLEQMYGINRQLAEQEADKLQQEEKEAADQAAAADKSKRRNQKVGETLENFGRATKNAVTGFATGATSLVMAQYSAANAFQAAIPALDFLKDTIINVSRVITSITDAIPYLGKVIGIAVQVAEAGLEIAMAYAKMQIQLAEKVSTAFNELAKAGAMFGGNIENFGQAAHRAGLDVQTYSKFFTTNKESLLEFGGGLDHASVAVAKLAKGELNADSKLLRLYGGVDGLLDATAQMAPMITGLGLSFDKTMQMLQTGSMPFLSSMKAFSQITGKTADALKKEEEERRNNGLYLIKERELSAKNVLAGRHLTLALSMLPEESRKYAQEFFSRDGEILSRSNQIFRTLNPELAKYAETMVKLSTETPDQEKPEEFVARMKSSLAAIPADLQRAMDQNIDMYRVAGLTQNEIVEGQSKIPNEIAHVITRLQQLSEGGGFDDIIRNLKEPLSKTSKDLSALELGLMQSKIATDKEIMGSFASVIELIKSTQGFSDAVKSALGGMAGIQDLITTGSVKMTDAIKKLVEYIHDPSKIGKDIVEGITGAMSYLKDKMLDVFSFVWDKISLAFYNVFDDVRESLNMERRWTDRSGNLLVPNQAAAPVVQQDLNKIKQDLGPLFAKIKGADLGPASQIPGQNGRLVVPEAIAGGPSKENLVSLIAGIMNEPALQNARVSAMNDLWHHDPKNVANPQMDPHVQGRAADISLADLQHTDMSARLISEQIQSLMKKEGLTGTAKFERGGEGGATGDHIHVELSKEDAAMARLDTDRLAGLLEAMNANLAKILHTQ